MVEIDINKTFLTHNINLLENALNERNGQYLNSIIANKTVYNTSSFNLDDNYYLIEIQQKEINVIEDRASIICQYKIYSENNKVSLQDDTLKMIGSNNNWYFDDLGKLTFISKEITSKKIIDNSNSKVDFEIVTPFISDRTYIIESHYIDPEIFEINANRTMQYLDRQLYGWGSEIDEAVYVYSVNPNYTINGAIFTLDSKWNRIVYSRTGSNDTKSYGDHPSDVKFIEPTAIDANEFGEVRDVHVTDKTDDQRTGHVPA